MRKTKDNPRHIVTSKGYGQIIVVSLFLLFIMIGFGFMNPAFLSVKNLGNLLRQIAPVLLIGIGQSFVMITGNIDLSMGSITGMGCMISATLMTKGISPAAAVIITLISCLTVGLINGSLISVFNFPPFIATMGTMTIARGIAQIVNNNYNTDAIGKQAKIFRDFFYYGKFLNIYMPIWITLIFYFLFNAYLTQTRTGRQIYAAGSNPQAARLSGVNISAITIKVYLVSAFCSCIVGLIICATSGMGTMDAGTGYELNGVAASVIGGISPLGGQGLLLGTVLGAAVWSVLENGLQFAGSPVAIRNIVIGAIVILSVFLDVFIRSGRLSQRFKR